MILTIYITGAIVAPAALWVLDDDGHYGAGELVASGLLWPLDLGIAFILKVHDTAFNRRRK